jgi:hypothetical protein
MIIEENQADVIYLWLAEKLKSRSKDGLLPPEMPFNVEEVTLQTWRDGKGGYILYAPDDGTYEPLKKMEMQIMIDHGGGYMKVGMENAYTLNDLSWEFQHLTQRNWGLFPLNGERRLLDGTVVHPVTGDENEFHAVVNCQEMQTPAPRITEERGRGTRIANVEDRGRLLQFWAWKKQPLEAGVLIPYAGMMVEYWMWVTLQKLPGDEDPKIYHGATRSMDDGTEGDFGRINRDHRGKNG